VPNLQATISNQLTATAAQTTLSIQELVTTMKAQGMADQAIRQTLLNDLNSGGQLFGSFRNKLKNTVKNGVELNAKDAVNNKYKDSGVQNFQWISVGDGKVCADCEERHRETGTYEFFETIGLPASGFSICQTNCRCQLVPEDYKGENLDKPLIRDKKVPLKSTDFKMAGKHKTAKDSLAWMKSNIADKVQLNQIKDVAVLNEITISLKNNFEKFGLNRLEKITYGKGRSMASASGGKLFINQKKFTRIELDNAYRTSVGEYGKFHRDHLALLKEKLKEAQKLGNEQEINFFKTRIKHAEKAVLIKEKYKRFNAFDKNNIAKSVIDHEIGHIVHDQYTGIINGKFYLRNKNLSDSIRNKWNFEWQRIYRQAKREGLISQISEYASADYYELFAESFAMYVRGEKLPDIIQDYLDRYLTTTDFD
jgi:hypothetical protein